MNRVRTYLPFGVMLLVAIPYLVPGIPPLADLPQHLGQVSMLLDYLAGRSSGLEVHWLTPYSLVYLPLLPLVAMFEPVTAGRIGTALLAVAWVGGIFLLARRRKRGAAAAVLASLLVFNHLFYWGFLQFAAGFPLFLLWFLVVEQAAASSREVHPQLRDLAFPVLLATALYFCHVLWFLASAGWLVLSLGLRRDWRLLLRQGTALLPGLVLTATWFPSLKDSGFQSPAVWDTGFFERMSPGFLVDGAFGGLHGPLEPLLLAVLAGWILLSAVLWYRTREGAWDLRLGLAGGLMVIGGLALPDLYTNTINFGIRWIPGGLILLVLAVPRLPRIQRPGLLLGGLLLLVTTGLTTAAWRAYEVRELSGLEGSVRAIPEGSRVLGLDFVKRSEVVKGRPFVQLPALAQLRRHATMNFSFADFGTSLVVYSPPRKPSWNMRLFWRAEQVRPRDFQAFDYLLVNAAEDLHRQVAGDPWLEVVQPRGAWRLYRVRR